MKTENLNTYKAIIPFNKENQFIDAKPGLDQNQYNKWLKESKKTFLGPIPTNSLLYGDNHIQYIYEEFSKYSSKELSKPLIGELNAKQIATLLDMMDLYVIMSLITENNKLIEEKIHANSIYNHDIECTYYGEQKQYAHKDYLLTLTKLIGNLNNKEIYSYPFQVSTRNDSSTNIKPYHIKQIYGYNLGKTNTANELMFKFLKLPISVVLSSINEVNKTYYSNLPFNEELCMKIEQINKTKPEKYNTLRLVRKQG